MKNRYTHLILLIAVILSIFIGRMLLALSHNAPRLFDLFSSLTMLGALWVLVKDYRRLRPSDWLMALGLGALVGAGMLFATLFSPYPFFGIVRDAQGQALMRGLFTFLAALGGLVILRQDGPVPFPAANGQWGKSGGGILLGLAVGLPLAVINVFALRYTQGQAIQWQSPLAALLDALQPGIVEEVIYRFALWGLLWLVLRNSLPEGAPWLAGLLATLVHTFAHLDALFVQAPLAALGMGLAMFLLWGLPLFFLARCRGLESAMAFHWIQDVARFVAGF
uniref:CAAX prenyl protease 2/Lysostaphin resistance protein A-like domain-containing protein n=1 Tax=Caldilinea aerophila TaxID=133453 RepID=A0A7C1JBU1_9CHLR